VESIPTPEKIKMKTTIRSLFALCCLLCTGTVLAQDHVLTYTRIVRPVDSTITILGDSYKMVRIPVRDMVTGSKYSVIFPAQDEGGSFLVAFVIASHEPDGFVANMTIDGFPAQVQIFDTLNYVMTTSIFEGGNDFTVTGSATINVSIDLGETIMSISNSITAKDAVGDPFLTNVNIGDSANAVPYAQWGKYLDQTNLVTGLDHWIDNIRIQTL
jgi:hypothetical protein